MKGLRLIDYLHESLIIIITTLLVVINWGKKECMFVSEIYEVAPRFWMNSSFINNIQNGNLILAYRECILKEISVFLQCCFEMQ